MLKNFNVNIYSKAVGTKINGMYVQGALSFIENINVDLQFYSTALLIKNYGWDIETNKLMLVEGLDTNILIGSVIEYTNPQGIVENYEVMKLIPWTEFDCYMEVFLHVIAV